MKNITLSTFALFAVCWSVQAQQLPSDDPSFQQNTSSKQLQTSFQVAASPALAINGTTFPCGGGSDTLTASGVSCGYIWSTDSAGMNVLSVTDSVVFGPITSDTTIYLASTEALMDSAAPLPPHGSNYSGNVRGYYFTAPVDFIISGLWVPTEASGGGQNIEVLLFDNQTPPPAWSATTNAFTSLGYWSNHDPLDTIDVCIPVSAGDVIGIYGNRDDINSYASGPYQSMIGGVATTFTRTGMQLDLSTNQMANVFSEASGSISRVEFFYDLTYDTVVTPVNIFVPNPVSVTNTVAICDGDSIYAGGAYQTTTGIYVDSLQTIYGCDSLIATDLTINMPSLSQQVANICQGDSILLGGALQTTSGVYTDYALNSLGCDSIIETTLTVNPLPSVTLLGDTVCLQDGTIPLNGSPAGGVYSGTNVSGSQFDATAAGVGTHSVMYVYTDSLGCANSASSDLLVEDCASIGENTLGDVKVYPNPSSDYLEVVLPEGLTTGNAVLYDANGRIVGIWTLSATVSALDIATLSAGIYVIEITNNGLAAQFRVVKK